MTKNNKLPEMVITRMALKEIKPYGMNAKEHPPEQIDQICRSIEEFGFNDPIAISADNTIIEGHGRYLAALQLKMKNVPVIKLGHLSPIQLQAYIIAHNKLCLNTGFDQDILLKEIKSLLDADFDISLTGFSLDEFDIGDLEGGKDADAIPMVYPERVAAGEIWQLGDHKLICGDSTNPETYEALMSDTQADQLLTDPPYNVNYKGKGANTTKKIVNDNLVTEEFIRFLNESFLAIKPRLKLGAAMYVFHASTTAREFQEAIESIDGKIINPIIWVKKSAVLGWGDYQWKHDPIFYAGFKGYHPKFYGDRKNKTVWEFDKLTDKQLLNLIKKARELEEAGLTSIWRVEYNRKYKYHPTQKPVELLQIPLKNSSKPGDIILDPFVGSGSTIIACEVLKRKCRAIELDPKYCDAILARWEYFTGKKAEKI